MTHPETWAELPIDLRPPGEGKATPANPTLSVFDSLPWEGMESTGLGDEVEQWLASGTDVRRLAVPTTIYDVPGLGPLLVIAVLGWPDSITVLTVEPGLGLQARQSNVRLALRDDLGGFHPFRHGGGGGGGAYGRMIFNSTFADPVPPGTRALHLYGLPAKSVSTHTAHDPLPPHVTIELD